MTLPTIHSDQDFGYWGENKGWGIALSSSRDGDAIERSNFKVISNDLTERFRGDVVVERMVHWMVGWVDHLLVRPDSEAWAAAEEWHRKLENYPVADDEDYSNEENEEALTSMARFVQFHLNWYSLPEREVAGHIIEAFRDAGCDTPGLDYTNWPCIERTGPYRNQRDRDLVANGLWAWRKGRK